jgi:hypothetical protein
VASDAEAFLRQLDEAAYGQSTAMPNGSVERAASILKATETEALPRTELRLPPILGILLLLAALPLSVATVRALGTSTAEQAFDAGVRAYTARQFVVARGAFANAAAEGLWAPDAWANLGTAAWAAGDTANAVVGWQRALRLEPGAGDLRDRLQLAQPAAFGSLGFVPPVSSTVLLWSALVTWSVAWLFSAIVTYRRTMRGRIALKRWAYAAGILGLVQLLSGLEVDQRLAARDLTVIRSTTRLSSDPALGGEAKGTAVVGEVARAVRRQGAWTFVSLDDQREGWVESTKLASLERGASPE